MSVKNLWENCASLDSHKNQPFFWILIGSILSDSNDEVKIQIEEENQSKF